MNRILLFVILCIFLWQSCLKQDTITSQIQFKSDTTSISNFVKSNNPVAIKVNTGFWYSIDNLENGVYPVLPDTVTISYTVKWIKPSSQQEADLDSVGYSTFSSLEPLSSAISGLQQGLLFFPAGSSGRIYIPSGLAFGVNSHHDTAHDTSQVSIPPNANLLYEVKVIRVKSTRLATDISTIDNYLQNNSIAPLNDDSGIRYTIDYTAQTTPTKPESGDSIVVTYKEKILTDTVFTSVDTPTKMALKDQVTAWRIMLPKYSTEGSTITMYTPSGYAYGSSVQDTIPANSNFTYVVTLIKVIHH